MRFNGDSLSDIENGFASLKTSSSDLRAAGQISDGVKALLGTPVTVEVIHPKNSSDVCDVMSIYPSQATVDALVDAIVQNKPDKEICDIWRKSASWIIEIDDRILGDKCGLTPRELTALILHEVGHGVENSDTPMRMCKVIKLQLATADKLSKEITKDSIFSKILTLPILNAGAFNRNRESMKKEMNADRYAINNGYGRDLNSAIDKILGYVGGSKATPDEDMATLMNFSVDTVNNMQKRQDAIVRRNFFAMLKSTPSRVTRNALNSISKRFIGESAEDMTEQSEAHYNFIHNRLDDITERTEDLDTYLEFNFPGKVHRMKKLDPMEIDYIGLEVNNIKTNDDKIMVISYIYSKLDVIDYYIALIDSNNPKYVVPHTRESLVRMRNTLNNYRLAAINKKLPEVKYGINYPYPTGYEG